MKRKLLAEFTGTLAVVFFCAGSGTIDEVTKGAIGLPGISFICGAAVMIMICALGAISGAHFNPAVSIAFALDKRIEWTNALLYILMQLAGAVCAAVVLKFLFPDSVFLGMNNPSGSDMQSFVLEMILSFILMLVILRIAHGAAEEGLFAGIAIGALVGIEVLLGGSISGGSMNPARSAGPAIIAGNTGALWIYIAGPLTGMAAAVPFHRLLRN